MPERMQLPQVTPGEQLLGICFSPGSLMVGLAWEVSPPSLFLTLPLLRFRIERAETDYDKEPWPWGWSLF
jgi:hypothetical protein